MSHKVKGYVAVYGNTKLKKVYCKACDCETFVIKGVKVCCDKKVNVEANNFVQECPPQRKRRIPPPREQKKILESQNNRCFYCERRLGSVILKNNKIRKLRVNWDHKVPYSYSLNNKTSNFVASCQICNSLKYNFAFNTLEEARLYLLDKWEEKGYTDITEEE